MFSGPIAQELLNSLSSPVPNLLYKPTRPTRWSKPHSLPSAFLLITVTRRFLSSKNGKDWTSSPLTSSTTPTTRLPRTAWPVCPSCSSTIVAHCNAAFFQSHPASTSASADSDVDWTSIPKHVAQSTDWAAFIPLPSPPGSFLDATRLPNNNPRDEKGRFTANYATGQTHRNASLIVWPSATLRNSVVNPSNCKSCLCHEKVCRTMWK